MFGVVCHIDSLERVFACAMAADLVVGLLCSVRATIQGLRGFRSSPVRAGFAVMVGVGGITGVFLLTLLVSWAMSTGLR